ncbi:MAG TPA: BamA/TamA family outer membrane protein [Saprospiraceae bacterium]|nr:BamA/TamA family outer membrane protein [Saprospiraceae bacterium]
MGSFPRPIRFALLLAGGLLFSFFGYSQKKTVVLSADSLQARQRIGFLVDSLQNEGHLEASMDQWNYDPGDSTYLARLHLGPVYEWRQLELGQLPAAMQVLAQDRLAPRAGKALRLADWQALRERLLRYAEDHGYPFARIRLEISSIEQQAVRAKVIFDSGDQILLDSLEIIGDTRLDPFYVQSYLGLKPGNLFSQQELEAADRRLRELSFLKIDQGPDLRFSDQRVQPVFYLSDQRASRFDFIIGVLPNSQQTGRLLVTADLEAELRNAFGKGERIYGHFEQLRPATQELELALDYPYLFRLPFGTRFDFGLYKRDSSFLDLDWEVGLQYLMRGGNYIQFFWQQQQSNLLSIDRRRIEQQQALPNRLDLRQQLFGLGYAWQNFDYRFNPRRGWQIELSVAIGNKRIRRNASIEELGFGFLYDSLNTNQLQGRMELKLARHFPLFQSSSLRIAANSGFIFSEARIYQNEQFRLGGNQLLRGFDEEFFFAQQYAVGTLEYRLLISQNSFLFTFFDGAWLKDAEQTQYPFGFGAGISLETSGGLFGLSLAYGKSGAAALDLTSPKVHFGYVSLF